MNILVVGNVLKDVYLNLDSRTEDFETDKNNIQWLNISFNASEHHFFNRESSLGGAAVTLEVLEKMGLKTQISGSDITIQDGDLTANAPTEIYRYILIADGKVSYFVPSQLKTTKFVVPTDAYDYIYIDRSATLDVNIAKKINAYLDISPNTKLVLYLKDPNNLALNNLIPRANLLFIEKNDKTTSNLPIPELSNIDPQKIISLSENEVSYLKISETLSLERIDMVTHLSAYSILAATILGGFILGHSVEDSLKMARANAENSKLNTTLTINELQELAANYPEKENLSLIAANLVLEPKGILAADESGGSIKKKFAKLNIPDTYENRRDYRNIFFTTPDLEKYVNGVILFDETARQSADNGQNFVDFLTAKRIIPGIKVDQGLETFANSTETYAKGLEELKERLIEYHNMGLRFAKWRAAFEIRLSESGDVITPTDHAIKENCEILAKYAKTCQESGIVPIVEPEVVYDGYYPINKSATVTAHILDNLFQTLKEREVDLTACILKTNMVIAGKNYDSRSTPEEVGYETAKVLKEHVPPELAGIVFLSGGQTVEQATENLSAIIKHGPFPWPVTFSFARALQDPALYAWAGNNNNANSARSAFKERLIANAKALIKEN